MDEAGPLLARALRFAVGGAGLGEMVGGCAVFELLDAGQVVGAFAAELLDDVGGKTINITAAGGKPGHDICGALSAWADVQARSLGAVNVTCETKRRGLVRRLAAAGCTATPDPQHLGVYKINRSARNGQ